MTGPRKWINQFCGSLFSACNQCVFAKTRQNSMKMYALRILKNPDSRGYFFAIYTTPRPFVPLSSVKPREGSKYKKNVPSLDKKLPCEKSK